MRLSGAGASRLSLPFQFALRTRKHNLVRLGEFANLVACAARPLWSGASVVERCARAVAYLAHHIARATATAEQGQQERSWFSTCSQCCADDCCSSRPPTCGRSTSTMLVRGTSQRHPPSLLSYRYSPGCWMPLTHPHCDGCRSTPASLTTTEDPTPQSYS